VAGVSAPDWLCVIDRKVRARERLATPYLNHEDPVVASVARGVVRHHHDDGWFHQTRAFAELNLEFTVEVREALPPDRGFRPSFLGHILVELLLDATLIEQAPEQLDAYYEAIASLDGEQVEAALGLMVTKPAANIPYFIDRFIAERFLYDYADDERLLMRLNNVMQRVKLSPLPKSLTAIFPRLRKQVQDRQHELLEGESE